MPPPSSKEITALVDPAEDPGLLTSSRGSNRHILLYNTYIHTHTIKINYFKKRKTPIKTKMDTENENKHRRNIQMVCNSVEVQTTRK